jgi:hypothetical protein
VYCPFKTPNRYSTKEEEEEGGGGGGGGEEEEEEEEEEEVASLFRSETDFSEKRVKYIFLTSVVPVGVYQLYVKL